MMEREEGESFQSFCARAREWFQDRADIVTQCAVHARDFLRDNRSGYNFDGTLSAEKHIIPQFPRNLSPFLNGENISNARLRGLLSGLWEMLGEASEKGLTPSTEGTHGLFLTEATLQLLRDLEFKRLRPLDEVDTLEDVRTRYYSTPGNGILGGKHLHRFAREKVTPLVAFGLVDARRVGRGYDIVSGPVLIAFMTYAYEDFLERHKLGHPLVSPDS